MKTFIKLVVAALFVLTSTLGVTAGRVSLEQVEYMSCVQDYPTEAEACWEAHKRPACEEAMLNSTFSGGSCDYPVSNGGPVSEEVLYMVDLLSNAQASNGGQLLLDVINGKQEENSPAPAVCKQATGWAYYLGNANALILGGVEVIVAGNTADDDNPVLDGVILIMDEDFNFKLQEYTVDGVRYVVQ